ncbi:hypothetical protein CEN39_15650 [Fischerella thermalis CCMEE 5201]|jgi:hypothetical protein|nr:hypothetical protein CEN39_15650 [Fischerella thermalis CCMEE 5201]
MRFPFLLGTALTLVIAIAPDAVLKTQAVQLRDGTVYFVQPPSLEGAITTYKTTYAWGATYYFTINLPENAGEPLQKITINQHEGVDRVRFDLEDTVVFEGKPRDKGQKLQLKDATSDRKTRTVSLIFDPPIPPGKTITIGLKPYQNPGVSGVYLFGVKAFPAGEKSYGQFLGYGRLQFYSPTFL